MNDVIFWIKKMDETPEGERPQVLIDACKALPHFSVSYSFEDKRMYITADPRKKIKAAIKNSGLSVYQISSLLNIDRTSLQKYLTQERNIPYEHLCKLLALI